MRLKSFMKEAADSSPKVVLVRKHIWLNLKWNDDVIGWQTKQGFFPAEARGLAPGDLLIGPYSRHVEINYTTVVRSSDGSLVKGASPGFTAKEFSQLVADKVLKVVVK